MAKLRSVVLAFLLLHPAMNVFSEDAHISSEWDWSIFFKGNTAVYNKAIPGVITYQTGLGLFYQLNILDLSNASNVLKEDQNLFNHGPRFNVGVGIYGMKDQNPAFFLPVGAFYKLGLCHIARVVDLESLFDEFELYCFAGASANAILPDISKTDFSIRIIGIGFDRLGMDKRSGWTVWLDLNLPSRYIFVGADLHFEI